MFPSVLQYVLWLPNCLNPDRSGCTNDNMGTWIIYIEILFNSWLNQSLSVGVFFAQVIMSLYSKYEPEYLHLTAPNPFWDICLYNHLFHKCFPCLQTLCCPIRLPGVTLSQPPHVPGFFYSLVGIVCCVSSDTIVHLHCLEFRTFLQLDWLPAQTRETSLNTI